MINKNNLTITDIENLINYYCNDGCFHSCDECLLKDFKNELLYTIDCYNNKEFKNESKNYNNI